VAVIAALISGWAWLPVTLTVLVLVALAALLVLIARSYSAAYETRPRWMREGL
jgi:hypothetical protein